MDCNYDVQIIQKVKEINLDMWRTRCKNINFKNCTENNNFSCPTENSTEPLNRKETTLSRSRGNKYEYEGGIKCKHCMKYG